MSAHSQPAAVTVPVALQSAPAHYGAWLQHIALATNQLMQWANQPRLVPVTVATLPTPAMAGMLAYVTDSAAASGVVSGGGTTPALVWHNGTNWKVVAV
jgi:hypothetical protein